MDQAIHTLIGMSIAYVASFIGLGLAWWAWRRKTDDEDAGPPGPPPRGDEPTSEPDPRAPGDTP